MRVSNTRLPARAFFLLALALMSPVVAVAAETSAFREIDADLRAAASSKDPADMAAPLARAESQLTRMNAAASRPVSSVEITGRAGLVNGLRQVTELDQAGNVRESIRSVVKSLDLSRTLYDAAKSRGDAAAPDLDRLTTALFDRLVRTGARDKNAAHGFGVPSGEELAYRVMSKGRDGRVSAFELTVSRATRRAVWRETPLRPLSPTLLGELEQRLAPQSKAAPPFAVSSHPFVLLVAGDLSRIGPDKEDDLRDALDGTLAYPMVPILVLDRTRGLPFTRVPSIPASEATADAMAGAGAVLIHRPTGAEIVRWSNISNVASLAELVKECGALAEEVAGDLGRPVSLPAGAPPPALDDLIAQATNVKPDPKRLYAVRQKHPAISVEGGIKEILEPNMPLILAARFGDGWAQYQLHGDEVRVWLRVDDVVAYKPPPPAETGSPVRPASGKSGPVKAGPEMGGRGARDEGGNWTVDEPVVPKGLTPNNLQR